MTSWEGWLRMTSVVGQNTSNPDIKRGIHHIQIFRQLTDQSLLMRPTPWRQTTDSTPQRESLGYFTIQSIRRLYMFILSVYSEKDYRASSITAFILRVAWTTSTGDDWGRGLPSFLPLAWTGHRGSTLLLHLWQWKASLSRLMVATPQVREKMTWGLFVKDG
jgi:hypothetical protein